MVCLLSPGWIFRHIPYLLFSPTTPTSCRWDKFYCHDKKTKRCIHWGAYSKSMKSEMTGQQTSLWITNNNSPVSYPTKTCHVSWNDPGRMLLKQTKECALTVIDPDWCIWLFWVHQRERERMWMMHASSLWTVFAVGVTSLQHSTICQLRSLASPFP